MVSEKKLLIQVKNDPDSFLILYDRYFDRIWKYFCFRFSDKQTCEDLTAQTFERALSKIYQYDPERGVFASWLFGIARNAANHKLNLDQKVTSLPTEDFEHLPVVEKSPEQKLIQHELQTELLKYVQKLPERKQDILALKFSGGFTNREIAKMMDLSEQNVAVILFRTIRELRNALTVEESSHEL